MPKISQKMSQFQRGINLGSFGCLLILGIIAGVVWGYVHFFKYFFFGGLGLVALSILIDWRAPLSWARGWAKAFVRSPFLAIFGLASAAAFMPFTGLAIFNYAVNRKRIDRWVANEWSQHPFYKHFQNQQKTASNQPAEEEFADYEEIESKPKKADRDQFLD